MPISTLSLTNLGPFHDVEFDFDPQVNVFVSGPSRTSWMMRLTFPEN